MTALILLCAGLAGGFLVLGLMDWLPLAMVTRTLKLLLTARYLMLANRAEGWLQQAALTMDPHLFLRLVGGGVFALLLAVDLLVGWVAGLLAALVAVWAIRFYLLKRISSRSVYLAAELPTFLRLVGSTLRSGFSLLQALEITAREGPPLLATEMFRVIQAVNMGASLDAALQQIADRMHQEDIDLMVSAILISREVGGNLSDTMVLLADTIMERRRLRRHIQVLTAQARLSGWIISLLPPILLAMISIVNPDYTEVLYDDPLGWLVIGLAVISEGLGIWLIRRIIRAGEEQLS